MTLKTSFFNKAIYKSSLKRFAWGSVLYAVLLFLSSGFAVILSADSYRAMGRAAGYFDRFPLILDGGFLAFPLFLAIVVPTVVALLNFRFLHSKRQAVFIHSMPISRRSNFISTILASFTLMFVPVLINTLILMALSCFGYGMYFSLSDCLIWALYNIYPLFLMFSCAVFAACITGNGYGTVGINILIHSFLVIMVSNIGSVAQYFIYGYSSSNSIIEALLENNFVMQSIDVVEHRYEPGAERFAEMLFFAAAAVLIYALAYLAYKKRKIESVGNVAGFNFLNAVFKYAICFIVTLINFVMFSSLIYDNPVGFAIILIIISLITYSACEMLFKKTTRVLYSWKGYAVFVILFTAMIVFFANTSFFGYETRVPERSDIAKVGIVGSGYYIDGEFFTDDAGVIDIVLYAHKEIVKEIPDNSFDENNSYDEIRYLNIGYELKNGNNISRQYQIPKDKFDRIMRALEENKTYIKKAGY